MKRVFHLLFIFIVFVSSTNAIYGQSKKQIIIDSLLNEFNSLTLPTFEIEKSKLIIAKQLWRYDRMASDSVLNLQVTNLDTKQFPTILARCYYMKANRMTIRRTSLDRAYELLHKADSIAISEKMPISFRYLILNKFGGNLRMQAKHDESLSYFVQAATVAENLKDSTLMAESYIKAGVQAVNTENYFQAIDYYLKGLQIEGPHQERIHANLPNVYRKIENWEKVVEYGKRGLAYSQSINKIGGEILSLIHVGYGSLKLKDYPLAESTLQKAWDLSIKSKNRMRASIILSSLIKVAVEQENYDKALAYEKDITIYRKPLDNPSIFTYLGLAHLGKENNKLAEAFARKALKKNAQTVRIGYDMALYRMEANDCLQEALQRQGRFEEAFIAQKNYIAAKDTVRGKNTILNISSALNQQELAQQEAIHQLEKQQENDLHQEQESKFMIAGILGLCLLLVSWFAYNKLRQKNEKILSQHEVISKALRDKDILLREIHHRVKNNLQLISSLLTLQGRSINDEMAKEAIREGQNRVRSMALIHQDLYNKENLTGIGVKKYLEKLCVELFQTYKIKEDQVELILSIQDIELDIDTVVPLGLIINELITNSLKYAFSVHKLGLLEISLQEEDQKLLLVVKDNGRGFDQSQARNESFGSTLISALTAQLDGELSIESDKGTTVEISFKDYQVNK